MRHVSLREANQNFSSCIAEVEAGEHIIVTRRGKPIAEIVPHTGERKLSPERERARQRLFTLLKKGIPMDGKPLKREEIYDRG